MLAKEIPSSNPDPQNPKSQVGLSQSPFHPLVHLSLSQFAPNFFWSYFFSQFQIFETAPGCLWSGCGFPGHPATSLGLQPTWCAGHRRPMLGAEEGHQ